MNFKILYEDKHIIVCEKPPKVPSQPDKTGDKDMFSYVEDYLSSNNQQKTKSYVGLHHRLDRPVGGLMIFSKSKEGNLQVSKQIQNREIEKKYLAIVCGIPSQKVLHLENYLKRLGKINMSKVVGSDAHGAKLAKLKLEVLESITTDDFGDLSLVLITLETGRHHQIRVQLSNAGIPIWGDTKYNKTTRRKQKWNQIALWAYSLTFTPPFKTNPITLKSFPSHEDPFTLFKIKE